MRMTRMERIHEQKPLGVRKRASMWRTPKGLLLLRLPLAVAVAVARASARSASCN